MTAREPWFDARHESSCASQGRLPDPGPEGQGEFDERGWYHPPCDCGASRRQRDLYDRRYPTGLASRGVPVTGPWFAALREQASRGGRAIDGGAAFTPVRDDQLLNLLDIVEEAQALAAILATNGMGVGLLRHPPHAEVYQRLSDALSEAAQVQS